MTLYFDQNFNYICHDKDGNFKSYFNSKIIESVYTITATTGNIGKKIEDFAYKRANSVMRKNSFFTVDEMKAFVDGFLSAFCDTFSVELTRYTRQGFFESYGIEVQND